MKQHYLDIITDALHRHGSDNSRLPGWTSAAEILLYRETGDQTFLDRSHALLEAILEDYQNIGVVQPRLRLTGFKIPYRIVQVARLCLEEERLAPEQIVTLNPFFTDLLLEAEYERGSMNRAFGYLAAIHPILAWVPDHPRRQELLEIEQMVLGDLTTHFEPDEDSYGYGALTLVNMIHWFRESKLEHLYQEPKLRQCFENFLDTWSGIGRAPIYGDWRPNEPAWGWYSAAMEQAAAVYQDGRFKWAARCLRENYQRTMEKDATWFHPHDLYGFVLAFECCDDDVQEVTPDGSSRVIYRNNGSVERAVLRSGWDPGDTVAMISLASGNEHGHTDPMAINGLIGHGTILEDNGRNGVEPFYHNVLHVTDRAEDFPVPRTKIPVGAWQTVRGSFGSQRNYGRFRPEASFPFDYTHQVGNDIPRAFGYDPEKEWVFLVGLKVYGEGYDFDLGAVTLVGEGGRREIADFENQAWIGLTSRETDSEGRSVGRFRITRPVSDNPEREASDWATTFYIGVKLPGPFSIANDGFDAIEMDYRLSGNTPADTIQFLCIGEEEGYPRKWMFNELPHYPVQVRSFDDCDDSTRVQMDYNENSLSGRRINRSREVYFSKERENPFLVVADSVNVEDDRPYTAGPLWHVMNPVDLGEGWFEIAYEGRALIWLMPKEGTEVEVNAWEDLDRFEVGAYNSHVIYRKKACRDGGVEGFDTLIVPLMPGEDGKAVKAGVRVSGRGRERSVTIRRDESTRVFQ